MERDDDMPLPWFRENEHRARRASLHFSSPLSQRSTRFLFQPIGVTGLVTMA